MSPSIIVEDKHLQLLIGQHCFTLNVTCLPRDALDRNPWKLLAFKECSPLDMLPHIEDLRIGMLSSPSSKKFPALVLSSGLRIPGRRNVLLSFAGFLNLSKLYIVIPSHFKRIFWMKDIYVIQHLWKVFP